ncbi:MAG: hypothetical protein SGARI_001587, partial [Bacillariaceae sp.]
MSSSWKTVVELQRQMSRRSYRHQGTTVRLLQKRNGRLGFHESPPVSLASSGSEYVARMFSTDSSSDDRRAAARIHVPPTSSFHHLPSSLQDILNNPLWNLAPKKGTGFDNFLKRDKKNDDDDPDTNSNTENGKSGQGESGKRKEEGSEGSDGAEAKGDGVDDKETKKWTGGGFGPFRSQHNHYSNDNSRNDSEGGNGGNGAPPNFSSTMIAGIIMLGLTYMMIQNDDETATPGDFSTREITWNDFCNYLLETGQVEKIVVTNNRTMAKVFLKPGSQGLPQHQMRQFRYSDRRQQGAVGTDPVFEDSTHIQDGSSGETFGNSPMAALPSKARGHQHQIVYRFA